MSAEWGTRDMQARCHQLREDLVTLGAPVTDEELADYWPGGAENQLVGRGKWIYCYARYNAFLDRLKDDGPDSKTQEDADLAALKAFRDAPQPVELVRPLPDGTTYLACHPKSFETLTLLDGIEEEIRWLLERVVWLQKRWEGDAPEKTGEALALITRYELYAAWICTTEGVGAPFDPSKAWPPVPEMLAALEPLDVVNILRAHYAVNRVRLGLIANTLRPKHADDRKGSWATLAMRAAAELRTPADHLLTSRSFVSWFAEVALRWDERAEAHDQAAPKAPPFAEMVG